jgi:hypothetical protein
MPELLDDDTPNPPAPPKPLLLEPTEPELDETPNPPNPPIPLLELEPIPLDTEPDPPIPLDTEPDPPIPLETEPDPPIPPEVEPDELDAWPNPPDPPNPPNPPIPLLELTLDEATAPPWPASPELVPASMPAGLMISPGVQDAAKTLGKMMSAAPAAQACTSEGRIFTAPAYQKLSGFATIS